MNKPDEVLKKLFGNSGYGPHVFVDEDAHEVQHQLEGMLQKMVTGNMSEEDELFLGAIGKHFEAGTFLNVAKRQAGSWRKVAALADRLIQIHGQGIIHVQVGILGQNMDVTLALKTHSTNRRLDMIEAAIEQDTEETRAIMLEGIENARRRSIKSWDLAVEKFLDHFLGREW